MSNNDAHNTIGSLSLDDLLAQLNLNAESITSAEMTELIDQFTTVRNRMKRKEERERRQREKEEAERRAAQEQAQKDAHVQAVTSMDLPLDWENAFAQDCRTQGVHLDSVADALVMSLATLGRVDIEYISAITDKDYKTVICALKGSIYQNPETWNECFYQGWETAEEYLSGNVRRKYKAAQQANETYCGYFADNLKALSDVLPETVSAKDIYVTLGSPWVPVDVIDSFITHILKLKRNPYSGTKHDEVTGTWEIPDKSNYAYRNSVEAVHFYGTPHMEALYILERTLNMKTVAITDEVPCATNASGKKRVINKAETVLALEKQQRLIQEFQTWVWKDVARKKRLEEIFETNFSCVRRRMFDGSFLEFPTMDKSVSLYPYQKNAVARILFTPNTLLAHDVGSGKTYVMIAAGMELKRMGLSKKNLYVVPNSIVGQWESIFRSMYPNAKLLCVEPKQFTPAKREQVLEKMRDEDYDGIIMAYSCFELIPLSHQYYMEDLEEKRDRIREILYSDKKKTTAKLRKKMEAIEDLLSKMALYYEDDGICFDELGVTRLFVDEAHNYKNVPVETKVDRVLGISSSGSKKCKEMMDKVHLVQKQNSGGGVVLATGTPITNSITDAFIMQSYLQSGELAMLDLQSFDSWIGMFAERSTEFEIDVDTSSYRLATRFSKFHNLPELTSLLSSIADFHQVDSGAGLPDYDGHQDALVAKTADFARYLDDISHRADRVRSGIVPRTEDNMLKITTDGRKAALDLRLVDANAVFTHQSKVMRCAEKVFDIYHKTAANRSAQLVFCDTSTPKADFNVYDELKELLVHLGLPSGEIAYIHDAATQAQREALFAKVRRGEVRVLIGSTFKLGLGVNVQNKLIALHHLDVPWRPADMTQREGRILRQGNENPKVEIFRYVTEGSFDAYSWQLLETKQRFIAKLLSGSLTQRCASDVEGTVLDYAEVKALAVGNPLIKKRVELANELTRHIALQRKAVETRLRMEREKTEMPGKIAHQAMLVEKCRMDVAHFATHSREYDKEERRELRKRLYEAVRDNVLMQQETLLCRYQGFEIILPANMNAEKPYVWVQKHGRYYVEMGDAEVGSLIRVDNQLAGLPATLEKVQEGYNALCERQKAIDAALLRKEDYLDTIDRLSEQLRKIDKKLGVDAS